MTVPVTATQPAVDAAGPHRPAAATRSRRRRRRAGQRIAIVVGVVFFAGFTLYPLLYMLSGSFKSLGEIYSGFATVLPKHPTLENYRNLLLNNDLDQTDFLTNARNSLIVAVLTIVLTTAISVPAAFVLARRHGPLITGLRSWVRIAQVVGGIVVIIPLYLILRQLGLIDTLFAVSLAETIPASAFSIWVLVAFIRQVPPEVEEAARIDGAGDWLVLRHVILPLIRPGMMSVLLVVFLMSWNDFLNPLILLNDPSLFTVTVALYTFIGQPGQIAWGQLLGFGLLSCVPPLLVTVVAERHIVRGLTGGAIK